MPDDLTVEHILPSKWQDHWPMMNGLELTNEDHLMAMFAMTEDDSRVGQIVRRDRLKHTIGNLTLVTQSFNSSVSHGPFEDKRKEFKDQSILMMTKDFVDKPTWNEDEIVSRSADLFANVCDIWPLPASTE